ncbi:MAG: exonuclease SbcCD subunit D [Dehalococcoidia bacterium]|nr:exonuclease SbcCD subunit D [Dehalococcoidia bacterium]
MRILHTSDWHVGRTIRGRSRDEEHRAVLAEIAGIAREREVDLVLVAGDLFDTAAPSAAAEEIVYQALLDLVQTGARVALIAGNHDNPRRLKAVRPLLELARVHAGVDVALIDQGGCIELAAKSGETAKLAIIPWVSQRRMVTAAALMENDAGDNLALYSASYRKLVEHLCGGFTTKTVNLVMAHVAIADAEPGGGERQAQSIFDYWVPANVFPMSAQYVALGHIHKKQKCPAAVPAWYSGSPLQLDFGDLVDQKYALIVDVAPGLPAVIADEVKLISGKQLRTLRGTFDQVVAAGQAHPDAYLRVMLEEDWRAGLSDALRDQLPNAVDIRLERGPAEARDDDAGDERGVSELFAQYLEQRGIGDRDRVQKLFDELMEAAGAASPS